MNGPWINTNNPEQKYMLNYKKKEKIKRKE